MHRSIYFDLNAELSFADDGDRSGPQILHIDSPGLSLRVKRWRRTWQMQHGRPIRQDNLVTAEFDGDVVLQRTQADHRLILQRIHLTGEKCQIDEEYFHK